MKTPLNIVIFDGSLDTTPFIRRLCIGLVKKHHILVVGFDHRLPQPLTSVHYVSVGSASKVTKLFLKGVFFALKRFFILKDVKGCSAMISDIFLLKRKRIQIHNLETALALFQPDIIHCQWPSLLPWIEKYVNTSYPKVILSQRGYQNNVRAFVDLENLEYLRSVYPNIDGFHSVSQQMTINSNKIYASPSKIDRVVYSGFDLNELRFQSDYKTETPLRIISVGRPHWIKGYAEAIKSMVILKEQQIDFVYEIIGAKGDEELTYLLEANMLEDQVVLQDKIPQLEIYEKMKQASILLLPSLDEGLPNVLVEAMAVGTPIIATNCGGVAELVDQGTGMLVPTRNPKVLADAIKIFTEKPLEVILSQRIEARKRVESRHGEAQMIEGMENLYFEVLKS